MARLQLSLSFVAALYLGLTACNNAHADRLAPPTKAGKALAQTPTQSPYQVDLIGENGQLLDVYQHRGRFYVLGTVGQRYTIRVNNPTNRRVEALVSVDGLDVIDGKSADLRKRGYVVPPGGELRIDGFRVSTRQVATFRFSSVSSSYAGRKGKARNVGVIGVAIFEEQKAPEIIVADAVERRDVRPTPRPHAPRADKKSADYDYRNDLDDDVGGVEEEAQARFEPPADPAPAPAGTSTTRGVGSASAGGVLGGQVRSNSAAPRVSAKSAPRRSTSAKVDSTVSQDRCCQHGVKKKRESRPGLGTEFGERRHSSVTWTRFVRANQTVPTAMAELRYNDASGLQALGIQIEPVDAAELETRETANPFPGSFAEPPR